ncbi:MAG: hypothetical protein ACREMR_08990, partial [Gemmatimonadales bacterium]
PAMGRPAMAGLAAVLAAACAAKNARSAGTDCRPLPDGPPTATSTAGLAGEYRLTLVATHGPRAGRMAEGRLWLVPQDTALQLLFRLDGSMDSTARMPLIGGANVNLEAVGAVRMGALDSRDPRKPGVAVLETPGAIVLRLGAEANRRDVVRFDGGYTAFYVRATDAAGFAGGWASGVTGPEAEGYFCAVRMSGGAEAPPR